MDAYTGEIRLFAGSFAPRGWLLCDGSLQNISSNEVLFVLLGTNYGGDGQTTFGLPDLRGRVVVSQGASGYTLGTKGGAETVTLDTTTVPAHSHTFNVSTQPGTATSAAGNFLAAPVDPTPGTPQAVEFYLPTSAPGFTEHTLNPAMVSQIGSSQAHENRMPYLSINYIICANGVYPSQN